jgi:hypothetical protein
LNIFDRFLENTQIPTFTKIHPLGAELFHVDGRQTDMTKLIVAFHNIANTLKNVWRYIFLP